jgi:ribosomal protein L32E
VEQLDSFLPVKPYIRKWYISGKVPDEERDDIEERAEEAGIEVVE